MTVNLNAYEVQELNLQDPASRSKGGFQGLLVGLQTRVGKGTGTLVLNARDLERIARYAFDYRNGGWQARLMRIFGRTLGPQLGRQRRAA